MMYYVMKEEARRMENGKMYTRFNPCNAMMVCDDFVAANKYFEYCVSKKNGRFILMAESITKPADSRAKVAAMFDKRGVINSALSGLEELRSCSLMKDQQSGKYHIEEITEDWMVVEGHHTNILSINNVAVYGGNGLMKSHSRIISKVVTTISANGEEGRELWRIKNKRKVAMQPFEICYNVTE